MAADHRGRPLHAGKRTNQEMAAQETGASDDTKKYESDYDWGPFEREVSKKLTEFLYGHSKFS